jgi:hypothetical protein
MLPGRGGRAAGGGTSLNTTHHRAVRPCSHHNHENRATRAPPQRPPAARVQRFAVSPPRLWTGIMDLMIAAAKGARIHTFVCGQY